MTAKLEPDDIRRKAEELLRRARLSDDLTEKAELTEAAIRLLDECPHGHTTPPLYKRMRTKGCAECGDPGDKTDTRRG